MHISTIERSDYQIIVQENPTHKEVEKDAFEVEQSGHGNEVTTRGAVDPLVLLLCHLQTPPLYRVSVSEGRCWTTLQIKTDLSNICAEAAMLEASLEPHVL